MIPVPLGGIALGDDHRARGEASPIEDRSAGGTDALGCPEVIGMVVGQEDRDGVLEPPAED